MSYFVYNYYLLLLSIFFVHGYEMLADELSLFQLFFFFFKQKTAYEMRISDWSSDVCSSDLDRVKIGGAQDHGGEVLRRPVQAHSGFDHEPEGAFGADEQLPQIVASGVLDQVFVQFQQVTFTGDDFQDRKSVV